MPNKNKYKNINIVSYAQFSNLDALVIRFHYKKKEYCLNILETESRFLVRILSIRSKKGGFKWLVKQSEPLSSLIYGRFAIKSAEIVIESLPKLRLKSLFKPIVLDIYPPEEKTNHNTMKRHIF